MRIVLMPISFTAACRDHGIRGLHGWASMFHMAPYGCSLLRKCSERSWVVADRMDYLYS